MEHSENLLCDERDDRYEHRKRERKIQGFGLNRPILFKKSNKNEQPKEFLGIPCETIDFTVPSSEERQAMRQEFQQFKRAEFIKYLAETQQDALRQAGISAKQIEYMKNGCTPRGFNTHHKIPVFGGGTNDFSNLVLIRKEPWHDMIHYHVINRQTKNMSEGDSRRVTVPYPKSSVFVPAPQYKFLEKWCQKGRKTYGSNKNTSLSDIEKEAGRRAFVLASKGKGR